MSLSLLFEDGYEYSFNIPSRKLNIHFDYGCRFHEINMKFLHFHPFYEIYILLKGNAQHIIEGQLYEIDELDIICIKPYQLHKSVYYKNTSCSRLILTFEMSFFEQNFPGASEEIQNLFIQDIPIFRFKESIKEQFIEKFNTMYLTSKEKTPVTDFLITSNFMQFLTQLIQLQEYNIYKASDSTYQESSKNASNRKIQDIVSYIHQNYASAITLKSISDDFFISEPYLSRKFKQVTHFSLVNYIQQTRVKRAQELLLNTDTKIIKIMELCGFGSLSQFNRVFSSIAKLSPSEYRKQHKLHIQQKYT